MDMINHILFSDVENSLIDFPFHIQLGEINDDFEAHTHDFSELFIIISGEALHVVGNDLYKVSAGDVYVITGRSKVVHSFTKVNRLNICNVMIKDETYLTKFDDLKNLPGFQALFILEPQFRKEHQFESRLRLDYQSLKHVIPIITVMYEDYTRREDGFRTMFLSNLLHLVVYLSRVYTKKLGESENKLLNIASAVSYMESHFNKQLSLELLAKMAGISPRHFIRVFRQGFGESPINYLINLRIDKAISLIKETDSSIIEIAMECGFYDSTYFARKFKEATGMTPTTFRKLYRR